jgi:GNAT superfamily N-acetyltransferase
MGARSRRERVPMATCSARWRYPPGGKRRRGDYWSRACPRGPHRRAFVLRSYQRRGIGRALLTRLLAAMNKRGVAEARFDVAAIRALPEKKESEGIPLRARIGFKNRAGREASTEWASRIRRICVLTPARRKQESTTPESIRRTTGGLRFNYCSECPKCVPSRGTGQAP